jgi:hypothetical protein
MKMDNNNMNADRQTKEEAESPYHQQELNKTLL